jgi:hypothetical protein
MEDAAAAADNSDVCQVLDTLIRYIDADAPRAGNDAAPEGLDDFLADHCHHPGVLAALRRELHSAA